MSDEDATSGPEGAHDAVRLEDGVGRPVRVVLPCEVPLTLVVNEVEIATLLCTPEHLEALCVGFLIGSGLIGRASDVHAWSLDAERWVARLHATHTPDPEVLARRVTTTGFGRGIAFSRTLEAVSLVPDTCGFRIRPDQVMGLVRKLEDASTRGGRTGLHSAAVSPGEDDPEAWMEDVGRHNAVDKAIGRALLANMDLARSALVGSGRTSMDMISKAAHAGIPVLVSPRAPTCQAVLLARSAGLTLVGFTGDGGFTVFSHAHRVVSRG